MSIGSDRWKNLRRLLEAMSYDIVTMSIYWKMNNIEADHESGYPSLQEQLDFTEQTLYKCDMDEYGLRPVLGVGAVENVSWAFALLFDVSEAKGLVRREHPEDDFKIDAAFDKGRFIGWEVRFFDTFPELGEYIRKNLNYTSYFIYNGFTKLPFKPYDSKLYCWEHCETYKRFLNGDRVKTDELCPSCTLKDFQKVMKRLSKEEEEAEEENFDLRAADAPSCCEFCDFNDLTRFHEPCHSCDETMKRNLIRQGQLKIIE